MRSLYRIRASNNLQEEISEVEEIMYSTVFNYIDFFLLSFIFSYMLFPLHQSLIWAIVIFMGFGVFCMGVFHALGKWKIEKTKG